MMLFEFMYESQGSDLYLEIADSNSYVICIYLQFCNRQNN